MPHTWTEVALGPQEKVLPKVNLSNKCQHSQASASPWVGMERSECHVQPPACQAITTNVETPAPSLPLPALWSWPPAPSLCCSIGDSPYSPRWGRLAVLPTAD